MATRKKTAARPILSLDDLDAAGIGLGWQPMVPPQEVAPVAPIEQERDGPMARGVKQVSASVGLAGRLAARDFDGAAKNISDQAAYRAANPGSEEAQGLMRAWKQGDGIWGGIKAVAGEFADDYERADGIGAGVMSVGRNLQAMGSGLVEQVPNMALPMVGMLGGGAAGGAAAGPVGAAAGGWAGASAGNALVGTSEAAFRQLEKAGVDPSDAAAVREYLARHGDAILGETAVKGGVIGAVDVATAGLAHWLLSGPGKLATTKALTEMGVDMADKAAVKAATQTPVFKNLIAKDATYQATKVGAQKLLRNTGAAATEPVGEFAGEYGGSLAATGEADAKDAFLEAASSLGQSGIMFAGQKAIQAIKSPSQAAADTIRATEKVPESGALTKAVNAGVEAKAQAVEAGALPPALGERLTDTDMGAMLGGGGMAGRADPLAGALGMNNDAQAAAITNVANVAERRPPMPASDAARMLDEARTRGLDLAVAEHPAGGFVLVPPNWVTPDMAAQGEARLNETISRMQQADAAPVERALRTRTDGVDLDLQADPVLNYLDNLRGVNTPAARAYVRDFDAGRITPADVQQRMQAEQGLTPEQRIARAAAEAPAQTDPVADRLRQAVSQRATPAPTDILNPAGEPFKTRMAADRAAKKTPGAVVPVEGGFVVRPQESVNVQDVPQAPEVPQAAPAISPPGQAPQAVGAQPAGPAAGVPTEGAGAVEAAGVTYAQRNADRVARVQKAETQDVWDSITAEENSDPERDFSGTDRLKMAINARRLALKPDSGTFPAMNPGPTDAENKARWSKEGTYSSATTGANSEPTPPQAIQAAPVSQPSPVRLGRNNTPLNEGGKPFKTRKAAGDAKKLQPMMRVVTVPGGYALADKTPAQLAAEAMAARRLATPRTSARGEPIPAHAFVAAAGGLNPVAASDLGVDGNPRIGNRRLFSGQGRGLSMDQATQMLVADGYLSEGATVNDAFALIKRSLTQPQYNADGIERIAEAESTAQFEDYLAAQEEVAQDDEFDPFGPAPATLDGFSDDMLESSGYDAATDAIKAEVRALLEMANAQGIDTESIMLEAHEQTRNATEQDYYEAAKSALEAAIAGSNRDRGTPAGSEGQSPSEAAASAAEQGLTQPDAPAALELAAQTPAEAAAQQDAQEQAAKAEAAAKRAADAAAKAEDDRKRIAQASVRAADSFELGQDPMDSLTGQGSVFDAQEPEQQAPAATEAVAEQPITRADVEQARQQAATAIAERIDAMTAQEVQKIAARFLPTMGVKVPAGKARIKAAMADPKVNVQAAADEVGAGLADDVKRALQADVEGRVGDAVEQQSPQDFIPAPDGGLDYGEITPEMGKAMRRQAGKIRLRRGDETQGLVHIENRHAKDFAALGFNSAQDFVSQVASGFTKIYKGRGAALDVVLDDQARGMLIVSLEPSADGDFYDIKTATPIRRDQFKNEEPLWDRAGPSASTADEGSPPYPKGQNGVDSVPPTAPAAQPDTPKLTTAEAKALMAWEDLGQKDGVKTHALTFYESQANKDAKRGRMIVAKVSKGDRSATAWMVDGEDKTFGTLAQAKKLAEEVGMAKAVADGFVEQGAEAPKSTEKPAAPATTSAPIEDAGEKIGGARKAQEDGAKEREAAKSAKRLAERAKDSTETGLRVGIAPGSADPVTVRDGMVYVGKYEAVNYDTGEPVTVPKGSTGEAVAQALKDAGALSSRQRLFGLGEMGNAVMFSRRSASGNRLPDVVIGHKLGSLSSHPDYEAAKAGDSMAAARIASDLVDDAMVEAVRRAAGNAELIVPVVSVEATGRNKIPLAVARELADRLGSTAETEIVQADSPKRTSMDGLSRLLNPPVFDGPVTQGAAYVLVDDTVTQGGTFASLASHIRDNGGEVAGVVALTGKQYSAKLEPSSELLQQVRDRFQSVEPAFRSATGYGFDALTESEARYLVKHDDAESVRNRIIAAGSERVDGGDRGLPQAFARQQSSAAQADSNARNVATQQLVDGLKAKWTRAPEIIVARNMQDAQIPQAVRDYDQTLKSQGATGEPRGFIYKGKVYLLTDQLKGPRQIAEVLFHEVLGHYGLRGAFGDGLTPILKQLGALRRKDVVAKAREYGLFNKDALGGLDKAAASDSQIWDAMSNKQRLDAAEEVLAEMAQTQPTIGFVQRAIAAIRNWLRANVPGFKNLKLTDADIVQAYILPARAYVTRSNETAQQAIDRAMTDAGFIRTDDRINFSRTTAQSIASSMGDMTPDQEKAYKNVAGVKAVPTVRERMDALKANLGLKLRQGLVDQFAAIKQLDQNAYVQARMSKGTDGTLEAILMYGKPFMRDGAPDVDINDGGFAKVLASLKGEQDRWMMWIAAQRAEKLKAEGKENLMTDDDISALKTLNAGKMADGTARMPIYAKALAELNEYNDAMLKLAMDSGLIDQAAYDLMAGQPYVPFYRIMEDGDMKGPKFSSGLTNQKAWQKIKGGTQQLNADLLQNMLLNWSHLLQASAKNRAATATMDAAEKMAVAYKVAADTKGAVKVMRDGSAEHWMVEDPYLLDAISAIHYVPSPLMKPLAKFKQLLTWGVTVNPTFKIRNLIRDSVSAIAQSELGYNPGANVAKGWKLTAKDSQIYASMLASGGLIKFGTQENTDRLRAQVAKLGGVVLDKSGTERFFGQIKDLYDVYNEFGDRAENVNRAALYDALIKKGKTHAEAAFMARDLMDFSMSGSAPVVRFLTQAVPFLNARLVGLDKLGRAAIEDPRRFAAVSGAVALASLALLAAYSDDDDWKKREDWDRDAYWWFKIGGQAYRIPKPFEVGAIGTLAERTAELMLSDEMTGKRYMERVSHMLSGTFSFNPVPQAFKPLLDLYANKDSFTGRAIESQADQRLRPQDRYSERTPEVAKFLGGLGLPDPAQLVKGEYSALSPKQVEHLIRGYFSWVGTAAMTVSDFGLRPLAGRGERPDMRLKDVFIAGNFVENLPTGSSRYVTQMYEQARQAEQAYASYQEAIKAGDTDKAQSIKESAGPLLRNRPAYTAATRQLAEINRMAKRIEADQAMAGAAKRARLTQLEQQRHVIAQRVSRLAAATP